MFVLFEESGQFKAAEIKSEADSSLHIEMPSGKRSKIKRNNTLFTFNDHPAQTLLDDAKPLSEEFDIEFLWEVAPEDEFDIQALAQEYYGHKPSTLETVALLLAAHQAPIYFHRRGKGLYRRAPEEILQAALAAQEKKQKQLAQQQHWAEQLAQGVLPEDFDGDPLTLVTRPDKNSQAWKAIELASQQTGQSIDDLLLACGAWPNALALHRARFFAANFPKGIEFPEVSLDFDPESLPLADVQAYSIDDVNTTEIDDALSVRELEDGWLEVGIHVAAPALSVIRDNQLDELARARMATVYMPGQKIPMLPSSLIDTYSLVAGKPVPALSLYVQANAQTGEIRQERVAIERIAVTENLRHNELDAQVTPEALDDPTQPLAYGEILRPLWTLSKALSAVRDERRGKPENNDRIDYSFYLDGPADDPNTPVRIEPRQRQAPLDLMVSEYMILANATWARLLDTHNLPGIFRSQQAMRVRMSTHALPHDAMGVTHYAWCTSPLRRYVDLVNQRQLVALAQHGVSAALVAPYKPRDADLYALISAFEAQHGIWQNFQRQIERYWCIRWLVQNQKSHLTGQVIRDDLVRLDGLPLVIQVSGMPILPRHTPVEVEIIEHDELTLEIQAKFLVAHELPVTESDEAPVDDASQTT